MAIRKLERIRESEQTRTEVVDQKSCFCLPADFGWKWKGSESDASSPTLPKSRSSSHQSAASFFKSRGSDSDSPSSYSKSNRSSFHSAGSHMRSKGSDIDWPTTPSSISLLSCLGVPETEESNSKDDSPSVGNLRWFPYKELEIATNCFHESNLVPHAPYKVYRGTLPSGEVVNVRRLSCGVENSRFRAEIKKNSHLEHENLVCVVGFSDDQGEQLLVSKPLGNATLEDHLIGSSLPWSTRLDIALGVARAIAYLHSKQDPPIIHENLRPTNIFLGDDFFPKVASYTSPLQSSELVAIARSWEYHDPESKSQMQTEYCNVYSFGLILLQLLSGRPTHDPGTKKSLVHRVRKYQHKAKDGNFEAMRPLIDTVIADQPVADLEAFLNLALRCVGKDRDERPTMEEVVEALDNIKELG